MHTESEGPSGIVSLRPATSADADLLNGWNHEPHVIAATTDDPAATVAFDHADWRDDLAAQSPVSHVLVAEVDGRPVGALQVIDPRLEPTHYWGDIEPGLRALDIWIGPADALGRGYGTQMMRLAIDRCFADPAIAGIVVDPLASNAAAHRFYRRLGFAAEGRRRFGEDDCLVHRLTREAWTRKLEQRSPRATTATST